MEMNPGRMMKMISSRMKANGEAALKEKNLTFMQSSIVRYLGRHGGKSTQKEIEEYLHVTHPTVVGIISRMEKNGYLKCYTDTADKRQKVVEMTDTARTLAEEICHDIEIHEKEMVNGFSDAEIEQLMSFLERIYTNVMKINDESERRKIND